MQGDQFWNLPQPCLPISLCVSVCCSNLPAKPAEEAQKHRQQYEEMVAQAKKRGEWMTTAQRVWMNPVLTHPCHVARSPDISPQNHFACITIIYMDCIVIGFIKSFTMVWQCMISYKQTLVCRSLENLLAWLINYLRQLCKIMHYRQNGFVAKWPDPIQQ